MQELLSQPSLCRELPNSPPGMFALTENTEFQCCESIFLQEGCRGFLPPVIPTVLDAQKDFYTKLEREHWNKKLLSH